MTVLVTGGSKCGKSHFAESLFNDLEGEKIYIATMQHYGEEAFAAIERHRKMRSGKGFETIEQYQADVKRSLGSRKNEDAIAHHLFEVLRQMDDEEVQLIFTESFTETGLGQATMNRLLKAAGHQVISL